MPVPESPRLESAFKPENQLPRTKHKIWDEKIISVLLGLRDP